MSGKKLSISAPSTFRCDGGGRYVVTRTAQNPTDEYKYVAVYDPVELNYMLLNEFGNVEDTVFSDPPTVSHCYMLALCLE